MEQFLRLLMQKKGNAVTKSGGHDMKNLFQHIGNVSEKDIFGKAVMKIENGPQTCTKSSSATCFCKISYKVQNCLKDGHKKSAMLQG